MIFEDRLIVVVTCVAALAVVVAYAIDAIRLPKSGKIARAFGVLYIVVMPIIVYSPPAALNPGVGLDPSWTIALARAEAAGLVFGRDIVYTYGPLGYLVTRLADVGNFSIMIALALALAVLIFAATTACADRTSSIARKTLLLVGVPIVLANTTSDFWPPFFVILVLALRTLERRNSFAILGAGLFAGIFALTKFTIAIDIALIAFAYFAVELWSARKEKTAFIDSVHDVSLLLFGIVVSSSSKFLAIDRGWSASLALVALSTVSVSLASTRNKAGALTAVVLAAALVAMSPAYRLYVTSSVAVADGYSSALAIAGPTWQVESAVLWLAAFAVAAWCVRGSRAAPLATALAAFSWAVFKAGFVRQDLHVLQFYEGTLFAAMLLGFIAESRRAAVVSAFLLFCAAFGLESGLEPIGSNLLSPFAMTRIESNVDALVRMKQIQTFVDAMDVRDDEADRLPRATIDAIGDRAVDVIPTETDQAFASGLRWDPEPTLQTIVASTPALDQLDLRSLKSRRNDAIVYGFDSIDGRYPTGEEPASFRFVLCSYVPLAVGESTREPLILLHAMQPRCSGDRTTVVGSVPFGVPVTIPATPRHVTFCFLRIRPTVLGNLVKTLFRESPVFVLVGFRDGTSIRYRLVRANADDGLLVNPLPRDSGEFAQLFDGKLSPNVTSISLEADPRMFERPSVAFLTTSLRPRDRPR